MIDIHSHVLPGVDDGAETLDESMEIIQLAVASGTTDLVATPHAHPQYRFDEERVEEAFRILSTQSKGLIRLYRGADCHLTLHNVNEVLLHPTRYTINGSRYLLIEFSDFLPASIAWRRLKVLIDARIRPIITHPERNRFLQSNPSILKRWVQGGCLVQITAQSFLGRFGQSAKGLAESLMDRQLAHFVASDAHDCIHRPPDLSQAHELVSARWGSERAHRLFVKNPAAAIVDEPIEAREWKEKRSFLSLLGGLRRAY